MDTLDLIILAAAAMAAVGGYRLGFLGRVVSWLGLAIGFFVAVKVLPAVVTGMRNDTPSTLVAVAVIVLVGGAMVGQAIGLLAGGRLHSILPLGPLRLADRATGALVGAAGVVVVLWLLVPSLAAVPGWPARAVSGSAISRMVATDLPPPPTALQVLRRLLSGNAPEVFAALQPGTASGPPPAGSPLSAAVTAQVQASTVKVEGQACGAIYEGSGFAVGPDLVATNAHVVAGEGPGNTSVLLPSGRTRSATVVMFDPNRDLALLSVPGLGQAPLPIATPAVGAVGAVFGHPGGNDQLYITPARVATIETAVGPDIYDRHNTRRTVLVLASALAHGDSGGALADTSGRVIGVAFAISANQSGTSYALGSNELRAALAEPRSAAASTGGCLTSG